MLSLPVAERWLLAKAVALLLTVRLGLWLLPFARLRQISEGLARTPIRVRADERDARKVIWAVEAAARHLPWAGTCLTAALASQVMLHRREHPALVRIGVAGGGGSRLEAHAWVESGGEVIVGGPATGRYALLATLETNGR